MAHYKIVSKQQRLQRHKRCMRIAVIVAVAVLLVLVFLGFVVYKRSLTPTLLKIAEAQVQSQSTYAINEAIASVFAEVKYNNLITIEKNAQNQVTLISSDNLNAGSLAATTALLAQQKINLLFEDDLEIPIGTLSGIPLLSNKGPEVCVSVRPIGQVVCKFDSQFLSAGINQTLHRIFLNVQSEIELILPTQHTLIQISLPVLVCETLIVGEVPQTYLQGALFG